VAREERPPLAERLSAFLGIGTAIAVQERYREDAGDPLAAGIGFFGFLSLLPLLLLAVAAAGYIWDDPARQVEVAQTITSAVPGLETAIEGAEGGTSAEAFVEGIVAQRATIGTLGLLLLIPTGLKVVAAAMIATRVIFRGAVLRGVGARVRQVLALVGLGTLAIASAAASSLAATLVGVLPAPLPTVVALALTFVLDLALFLAAYALLSPSSVLTVRQLLPGAVLGAAGWTVLKVAGSTYVAAQIDSANALYGALGGVVALMLLLYLAGRLYVYGAELSAVRAERTGVVLAAPAATRSAGTHTAAARAGTPAAAERAGVSVDTAAGAPATGRGTSTSPHLGPTAGRPATAPRTPARTSGTVSAGTQARLADAERVRAEALAQRDVSGDTRTAVALGLTAAALVTAWRTLGRPS
jgi:membrane protein